MRATTKVSGAALLLLLVCFLFFTTLAVPVYGQHAPIQPISLRPKAKIVRTRGKVIALILSKDSRLVIPVTWEKKTELWDVENARLIATVEGRVIRPFSYSAFELIDPLSPDARTLVTILGTDAKVWDVATGKLKHTLRDHKKDIRALTFSPNGKTIATGSADGTVKLWNSETGALKATLDAFHVKKYSRWRIISRLLADRADVSVHFTDENALLSVPADEATKCWDVGTGRLKATLGQHNWTAELSPSGRYAVTHRSDFSSTDLWDTESGQLKASFKAGEVAFSPDEQWLGLVEHNGRKGLFNLKTMKVEKELALPLNEFLTWTSFSPNQQIFVQASGLDSHTASLVEVSSGKVIADIRIAAKEGFDFVSDYLKYWEKLSFHPSGEVLMGASRNLIRFWDSGTGRQFASLTDSREPAAFSANGKLLVTTDKDEKNLTVWDVKR